MLGGFIGDVHVLRMGKLMGLIPAATSWWGCTIFFFPVPFAQSVFLSSF
jgi:hypothetical protein